MTNEIQIFNNPEFGDVRTVMIDEAPWWVGKDITRALTFSNSSKALKDHVDDEDKKPNNTFAGWGNESLPPTIILINESGLYSLILSSKLPSAKKFKRWITSEVLPALRRTGQYSMECKNPPSDSVEQRQLTIDDYIRAASIIAGCKNERMPTVMALLEKSGIKIPSIEDIEGKMQLASEYEETGETASLINQAVNEYGMNMSRIAKLCGLHTTQITRIRNGQAKPKKDRARVIQDAIRREIERIK